MYLQNFQNGSMSRNINPGCKPIYGYLRFLITKTVMCLVCVYLESFSQYGRRRIFLRFRGGILGSLVCPLRRDTVAILKERIDNIQNTKMVRKR